MIYKIYPPQDIDALVHLPASKSISNRALIIYALACRGVPLWSPVCRDVASQSSVMPGNLSDCDDTNVVIRALRDRPSTVDIKAAGTAMRFMTAYLSITPGTRTLTGTERMRQRPISILVDALRRLGADIAYLSNEGYPPLRITGRQLKGGYIEVPGSISSQYISALLLIAPMLKRGLQMHLTGNIISRPYIDLTIRIMQDYGARVEWTAVDTIDVKPEPYVLRPYSVESDWSAASYWYEIMALAAGETHNSKLVMTGLVDGSLQGDSAVRFLFSALGVKTEFAPSGQGEPTTVTLRPASQRLHRLEYDFTGQPDMAQTFVVCCALMNIPFHFTGLATLKIKETDRIEALKTEMRRIGYMVHDVDGQKLIWDGERCAPDEQPVIQTYDDHRMALAFAPAALRIPGIAINNPEVVSKSYPHFWDDLRKAGFKIVASAD